MSVGFWMAIRRQPLFPRGAGNRNYLRACCRFTTPTDAASASGTFRKLTRVLDPSFGKWSRYRTESRVPTRHLE